MAKKPIKVDESISYEDAIKALKAISTSRSIIGKKEISELCHLNKIETGIHTLDFMLGGGLTEGRITVLAGNPSSCKSTITQQIIPAFQKYWKEQGKMKFVLIFDTEGAYTDDYSEALGIDNDFVIIKQDKKVLEDIFAEADKLMSTGMIGMLIIDSVDATIPKKVDDNRYENTMGSQSGSLAAHLPSLFSKIVEHNVTTVLIKQARVKLGVQSKGEIITFNGGKALRHFSDTILIMKRMSDRDKTYCPIQVKAEKTRSSRMGKTFEIPLGTCGIDIVKDLVMFASDKQFGVINVAGGGWSTFDKWKEQGLDRFSTLVETTPELYTQLSKTIYDDIIYTSTITGVSNTEELITEIEDGDEIE